MFARCCLVLWMILFVACVSKSKDSKWTVQASEQQSLETSKDDGAVYSIPQRDQPEGQIRIKSEGLVMLKNPGSDEIAALKITMEILNQTGQEPWTFDARQQLLSLQGRGNFRSAVASAEDETLPLIRVPPGRSRHVDLFYVLPPEMDAPGEIPGFTLNWQITAGTRLISDQTRFGSLALNAETPDVYPHLSSEDVRDRAPASLHGTRWWIDPFSEVPTPWRGVFR